MIKISEKITLGSEFPYCDTIQLIMIILFFVVWGLDSFICNYSTVLVGLIPLPLRLFLAILSLSMGVYLGAKSHKAVFGEIHDQPKLIDSGVYSWVRHPMYLGTLMFCLGFFFSSLSLLSLGVWIGFFILYDKMATYEEKDLIRILGEEYTAYQKRVPKWFPRLMITLKDESYKERSRAAFDEAASTYDTSSDYGFGKHAREVYPHILEKLREISFDSLLDIGTGTGAILATILEEKNFRAAGLDISPEMIEVAENTLKGRAELKVGDSEELPWEDNSFDVVMCNDSFHHFPNPQIVVNEMMRVLKPGGCLLISDVRQSFVIRSIYNFSLRFRNSDGDVRIYSKKEMISFVEKSGFQKIEWEKPTKDSYILTAVKPRTLS